MNNKPNYAFKMLIIGSCDVGKSSIIRKFSDSSFSDIYQPTISAVYTSKVVQQNECKIKLQFWDTPGQKKFRAIADAFYRGVDAVLIFYDVTNKSSYEDAKNTWYLQAKSFASLQALIFLVGNKNDSLGKFDQSQVQQFCYQNQIMNFDCSAKTGNNVDIMFMTIIKQLINQKQRPSEFKRTYKKYQNCKQQATKDKKINQEEETQIFYQVQPVFESQIDHKIQQKQQQWGQPSYRQQSKKQNDKRQDTNQSGEQNKIQSKKNQMEIKGQPIKHKKLKWKLFTSFFNQSQVKQEKKDDGQEESSSINLKLIKQIFGGLFNTMLLLDQNQSSKDQNRDNQQIYQQQYIDIQSQQQASQNGEQNCQYQQQEQRKGKLLMKQDVRKLRLSKKGIDILQQNQINTVKILFLATDQQLTGIGMPLGDRILVRELRKRYQRMLNQNIDKQTHYVDRLQTSAQQKGLQVQKSQQNHKQ